MNNQPIGILDSGVGGLSIWREIIRELPYESTIYVADSANCPYGTKTKEQIYNLSQKAVRFLIGKKVKLIIIACNTITVSCLDKFRSEFKNLPIIGVVPVVKTIAQKTLNNKIGIISTPATAKSKYQKELIKLFAQGCKVLNIGTGKLVPFVERGDTNSLELVNTLKTELKAFKKARIDCLALGCSHFPFLKKEIQKVLGSNVRIFDSGGAIARHAKRVLASNNDRSLQKKPGYSFYTTGNTQLFTSVAKKLIGSNSVKKAKRASL